MDTLITHSLIAMVGTMIGYILMHLSITIHEAILFAMPTILIATVLISCKYYQEAYINIIIIHAIKVGIGLCFFIAGSYIRTNK